MPPLKQLKNFSATTSLNTAQKSAMSFWPNASKPKPPNGGFFKNLLFISVYANMTDIIYSDL